MVSRNQNHLQRHVEECLLEHREMREWIKQAQALSPFITATERDWLLWGHHTPREWLYEAIHAPAEDDWDVILEDEQEELFALMDDYDWGNWEIDAYEEPVDVAFGGRLYPAEHVRDAHKVRAGPPGGEPSRDADPPERDRQR